MPDPAYDNPFVWCPECDDRHATSFDCVAGRRLSRALDAFCTAYGEGCTWREIPALVGNEMDRHEQNECGMTTNTGLEAVCRVAWNWAEEREERFIRQGGDGCRLGSWESASETDKRDYREYVRVVLTAARKESEGNL